jgi:putative spermidine/putrescine transport system ATP-binding protein
LLHLAGGTLRLPAAGAGKRIFVRAENVRLDPAGPLTGTVERETFLGSHYRLGLSGVTEGLLYAEHAGITAPARGEVVRLDIPADAILMIDESGAA